MSSRCGGALGGITKRTRVCGGVGVCERTMDGNAAGERAGEEGGQERFGVDPPEREASAPDCQVGKCFRERFSLNVLYNRRF